MFRTLALLGLLATMVFATPSSAQSDDERQNVDKILDIAKGWGSARLETDGVGDPLIVGRMEGTLYGIFFYDCDDDKEQCRAMQFKAGSEGTSNKISLREINALNNDTVFGKWFMDDEGDLGVKLAYNLAYGYTHRNLDDTFDWWRVILKKADDVL